MRAPSPADASHARAASAGAAAPLHVLFVLDTWGLIGGTERHAAVVVPALLARGHRVTVLCRAEQGADFARVPERSSIEVLLRPALEGLRLSTADRRELRDTLRGLAPDVVFHSALRNVDAAEELVEAAPVVRYVHDHTVFCPGLNKYREDGELCRDPMGRVCLERYFLHEGCICFKPACFAGGAREALGRLTEKYREVEVAQRAHTVLTNSHYMRAELLQLGFHPERTSVLYYFTRSNTPDQPTGPLAPETEHYLASSDAPLFFTPARLTLPDKGVDFLITALAGLQAPFRAVVAGSGPAEGWLREKARSEGLGERLHFTGWLGSAGIETLYARADVVVCPSVWDEPFGLVGIEAMVHEKPVVAFRVGGIPEWCQDGETGFLIERKNSPAMTAALGRLASDSGLRRRMGTRGRALVAERFPRERHVDGLEATLRTASR